MGLRLALKTLEANLQVNTDRRNSRLRCAMPELRTSMKARIIYWKMAKVGLVASMLLLAVRVSKDNLALLLVTCAAAILAGDLIESLAVKIIYKKRFEKD